jgi:hypothetical protein
MRFMHATAEALHVPQDYVREVLRPAKQQAGRAGQT